MNCIPLLYGLVLPFFLGPRQITASSGLASKKPTDMTPRLSSTYCKNKPFAVSMFAVVMRDLYSLMCVTLTATKQTKQWRHNYVIMRYQPLVTSQSHSDELVHLLNPSHAGLTGRIYQCPARLPEHIRKVPYALRVLKFYYAKVRVRYCYRYRKKSKTKSDHHFWPVHYRSRQVHEQDER